MEELDLSRTRIDHDQDAYEQLEKHVTMGHVYRLRVLLKQNVCSWQTCVSDLVIIEKQKPDGKLKRCVILNCLSSGVLQSP